MRPYIPPARRRVAVSPRRRVAASLLVLILFAFSTCRRGERPAPNIALSNPVATREVTLYFESPELLLVPETRTFQVPENDAAALSAVLRELLKGSANSSIPNLFPADSIIRATYLLPDGTAVIDIGGPSFAGGWNTGSHNELMAIYSIVQTLTTNFSAVRQVRLVVNGQPVETLAGHIRIDRPLRPLPYLVRP